MTVSSDDPEATPVEPSSAEAPAENAEAAASVKSTMGSAAPRKSGMPAKVIATVAIVVALGGGALLLQSSYSGPRTVKLTQHDMQVIFQEMLPPQKQQQIAASAEEKKKLVSEIKKLLAVAQVAEQQGYAERPDIKPQLAFQQDMALNNAYRKKNPDVKVSDEESNAYNLAHPKDFDEFLQGNPRFQQQAQGPQRDDLRKQYGEFKVISERSRKEGMDREDATRLQILLDRSQILAGSYLGDLQKNADKLVTDAEIEQYFKDHTSDFDEVRVRHILISTQPKEDNEDEAQPKDSKDKKPAEKPKTLTKDEARKKAADLLARVRKGEDFAKLAKENSDDPGSKDKGGEYDFFSRGTMVAEFEKSAFALKPGEVSDLVETEYGYHIIKLEERRSAQNPSEDKKVRQQILDKLKQEKLDQQIEQIAKDSSVVVPDDFDTTPKAPGQPQTSSAVRSPHTGESTQR